MEEIELLRALLECIKEDCTEMQTFINRVQRGDPRVCKPEYSNPRYFEKFK